VADSAAPRFGAPGYGADAQGFTEPVFRILRDLIADRTGVHFSDDKRDQLADKLSDLMSERGLASHLDYYYLLRYDAEAERHWSALVDRLAVPETFFWRQPEQILALANVIAPRHFARRGAGPLRIWSAACCTGEEPVSIAIALAEAGLLQRHPIEIVASDASAAMIARAQRGLYPERSFRALPAELRDRYFQRDGSAWRVDRAVHGGIRWATANLVIPAEVAPLARADVIFCRNVFIYFADETIAHVVRSFADGLAEDGHLFLGASESLARLDTDFELDQVAGAFVYVKDTRSRATHGDDASGVARGFGRGD
jgi:chemotaxis protein methyltransferase CheR